MVAEEVDQALELVRILRTDVGSLTELVLGITDTTNERVDARVAETGVDDDGASDGLAGWLQQVLTTIDQGGKLVDGGDVIRILVQTEELGQAKVS